jgi:hypothetical protein
MHSPAAIREWARQHGYTVRDKGRIDRHIHAAYQAVHGLPEAAVSGAARCSGPAGCGRVWTAMNECHCRLCHRHFSTVRHFDTHRPGECRDLDPLTIVYTRGQFKGEPKLRLVDSAWGPLYADGRERPEISDTLL